MASKELQSTRCAEQRRMDLRTWEAYIVWPLDAVQLRTISKFYNSTNHLNHAQPTWGGQMIGCREIWISCKRATNLKTDLTTRLKGSTFNLVQYNVRLNSKHVSSTPQYAPNLVSFKFYCCHHFLFVCHS